MPPTAKYRLRTACLRVISALLCGAYDGPNLLFLLVSRWIGTGRVGSFRTGTRSQFATVSLIVRHSYRWVAFGASRDRTEKPSGIGFHNRRFRNRNANPRMVTFTPARFAPITIPHHNMPGKPVRTASRRSRRASLRFFLKAACEWQKTCFWYQMPALDKMQTT